MTPTTYDLSPVAPTQFHYCLVRANHRLFAEIITYPIKFSVRFELVVSLQKYELH